MKLSKEQNERLDKALTELYILEDETDYENKEISEAINLLQTLM